VRIIINGAISVDGKQNTREGTFTLLGSSQDHARMSQLRSQADAVLIGGATFRNWPYPSLPDGADRQLMQKPIWNVIVTRGLGIDLPPDYFAEPLIRPLLLTLPGAVPRSFTADSECYPGPGPDLPVAWILEALAHRQIQTLLLEAGGDLLYQFLAADVVDELYVTVCPLLIGGRNTPSLVSGLGFSFSDLRRLRLLDSQVHGDELFLHYAVKRQG
jgi:5-amino-6-(5-phosphoribosylamino)uracil reductase